MSLVLVESRTVTPLYENRLAIPPVIVDCVGEDCQVAAREGSCFVDLHHLYHPSRAYYGHDDPVYAELRDDPMAVFAMARCRHEEEHERFSYTQFPPKDVVRQFLAESELLRSLGVSVANINTAIGTIGKIKKIEQEAKPSQLDKFYEIYVPILQSTTQWISQHERILEEGLLLVPEIEVMPQILVGSALTTIAQAREELALRAELLAA